MGYQTFSTTFFNVMLTEVGRWFNI